VGYIFIKNMSLINKNKIFIITGPSGAGEDSVIKGLKKNFDISWVITTVTRPMRKGESQGHPYYFISKEEFEKKLKNEEFIEYADVYGKLYGTTIAELERVQAEAETENKIGIWKIEWQGVKIIKEKLPNIVTIMIDVPSLEILKTRLIKRGKDSMPVIEKRLKDAKGWDKHPEIYDYTVVNEENKLNETIKKVAEIIKKHIQ